MSDETKNDQPVTDPSWVQAFLPGDPFSALAHEAAPLPAPPPALAEDSSELKDFYPPDLGGGD